MLLTGKGISGSTHYFFAFNASEQVWQTTTSTYVTFVAANYANYKITASETSTPSSGRFSATAPAGYMRYEMRREVGTLATDLVVWTSEKDTPIDIDGITFESAMEALLAVISGRAVVTGNSVAFKKRDGTTTKITVTYGAVAGERLLSEVNS